MGSRTKVSGLHRLNNPSYKVAAASFHFSYLMRDFRPVISAGLFLTTVRSKPRPHHRFMSRDAPRVTTYHFYPSLSLSFFLIFEFWSFGGPLMFLAFVFVEITFTFDVYLCWVYALFDTFLCWICVWYYD